jgi:hypothetical protein
MKARYLVGASLARAGDEMTGPAVVLLAFAVTGAPGMGSLLMACLTVAAAAGGPAFGAVLDWSSRPERSLAYALACYAAGIVVLTVTVGRAPLAVAALTGLAAGSMSPAVAGGWTSQLPRVVTADQLPRASALDAMSFGAASLSGPALAALITLCLGARVAVATAAGLVAIAVPLALRLPRAPVAVPIKQPITVPITDPITAPVTALGCRTASKPRPGDAAAEPGGSTPAEPGRSTPAEPGRSIAAGSVSQIVARLGREVVAGIAAIAARPALLRATATSAVSYVGIGMLLVCCPLLGKERLGGSAHGALLITVLSAASLTANGLLARRSSAAGRRPSRRHPSSRRRSRRQRMEPDTRVFVSTLVIGASLVMVAVAPGWLTMLAVAVDGVGEGPQLTALFTIRYREAPEHLRGRIFTTAASLKIAGIAVGSALAGPLAGASAFGVTGCLLVAAGIEAFAAVVYLLIRTNRPIRTRPPLPGG